MQRVQAEAQRAEQAAEQARREREAALAREAAARVAREAQAARLAQAAADEERREAARRAMGRQLDAEAAQREAAQRAAADARPASWSSLRRARLFGRSDPNAELLQYAESVARRIQLNTPAQQLRELAERPHRAPLVTVAIRQDGSVESIVFVQSSGHSEVDAAVRALVQGLAPYPAFPPLLASQLDVLEIRRTWVFSSTLSLQ